MKRIPTPLAIPLIVLFAFGAFIGSAWVTETLTGNAGIPLPGFPTPTLHQVTSGAASTQKPSSVAHTVPARVPSAGPTGPATQPVIPGAPALGPPPTTVAPAPVPPPSQTTTPAPVPVTSTPTPPPPTPTPTPVPTDTTPAPTDTPTPTDTIPAPATDTPTPVATDSPIPTDTPSPTLT